tara:strand:+ start:51 stop:242 length:192 start_codon:yes stop_codon:yes gene_type:complete
MICVISALSTILLLAYGLVLIALWVVKKIVEKWDKMVRAIHNTFNLPETTYQRVKVIGNRDHL